MTGNADPPGLLPPAEPNPEEGNLVLGLSCPCDAGTVFVPVTAGAFAADTETAGALEVDTDTVGVLELDTEIDGAGGADTETTEGAFVPDTSTAGRTEVGGVSAVGSDGDGLDSPTPHA